MQVNYRRETKSQNILKLRTAITDVQMWAISNVRSGMDKQEWNRLNDCFAKMKNTLDCMSSQQRKSLNRILDELEVGPEKEIEELFGGIR